MRFLFVVLVVTVVSLNSNVSGAVEDEFYAYYTKVDIGEQHKDSFGKYADIVVHLSGGGKVTFCRESSFLPYLQTNKGKWYFDEIIERKGDGTKICPDKINRYSHVRLIKNTAEQVMVHWRYVPDFTKLGWDSFVDEYFRIYPSGKVIRTIRKGTEKLDSWQDPANLARQVLRMSEDGIEEISFKQPHLTKAPAVVIEGNKIIHGVLGRPAVWWKFNEGMTGRDYQQKDLTQETIGGTECEISGHKCLWKKGISGTALGFDGYFSSVKLSASQAPQVSDGFTVEAWIAIGAYSWQWSPIVHQSSWGKRGYYLGIDDAGHIGFMAKVGNIWEKVISKNKLERFQWRHVAGTFDTEDGLLCIYLDGELISCNRTKREIAPDVDEEKIRMADEKDVIIGLNNEKMRATNAHRQWTYPAIFGFDGLIDEVKIYDEPLSWEQIKESYELYKPSEHVRMNPDMDERHFPANPNGNKADNFGAEYCKLDYYETWDNMWRVSEHPDVLVKFENSPARFAFWRGLRYGIGFVTDNGKWCGDQSCEVWGEDEARGCCEHMSDKQCRHSHVRIIENTDARAVVHWRYGEVDVRYKFPYDDGNGPWADEYWTFYPDGVGIRYVACGEGGWQETMFYSEPGTKPEDNIDLKAFTVIDEEGNKIVFDWSYHYPYPGEPKPACVTMVNMKSEYKPFYIYPPGSTVETFVPPLVRRDYSAFHWANHYPANQMASDGRSAEADDRAAHSSLVWGNPTEDYLMVGLTNKKAKELMSLAKSWNNPPKLIKVTGAKNKGYNPEERSYQIEPEKNSFSFELNGSEDSPIYHPAFEIKNWPGREVKAQLEINGREMKTGSDFEQGVVFDTTGKPELVIWIRMESTEPVEFELSKN